MARVSRQYILLAIVVLSGCQHVHQSAAVLSQSPVPPRALVLVVDGAGGFQAASKSLRQTVASQGLPIEVMALKWSHGYLRVLADHLDHAHSIESGHGLAADILARKQQCPNMPIFLVGHSAGSLAALTAAQDLPPNTLERIILLAPAVSDTFDLRPALAASRQGVDVFYSQHDWGYLGVGVFLFGTSDRCFRPAAGRVGFNVDGLDPAYACLYAKLRQYPWHPCVAWSGNPGGHYGPYQPGFLSAYVLPLLAPPGEFSPVISRADRFRVK